MSHIFDKKASSPSIVTQYMQAMQAEELDNLKKHVESLIELKKTPQTRLSKKNELNKSDFTALQTALLLQYLKHENVFLKDITNKVLFECFENATGFSGKQLKKTLNGKPGGKEVELNSKKADFDKLKTLFANIIKKIEKDKVNLSK